MCGFANTVKCKRLSGGQQSKARPSSTSKAASETQKDVVGLECSQGVFTTDGGSKNPPQEALTVFPLQTMNEQPSLEKTKKKKRKTTSSEGVVAKKRHGGIIYLTEGLEVRMGGHL